MRAGCGSDGRTRFNQARDPELCRTRCRARAGCKRMRGVGRDGPSVLCRALKAGLAKAGVRDPIRLATKREHLQILFPAAQRLSLALSAPAKRRPLSKAPMRPVEHVRKTLSEPGWSVCVRIQCSALDAGINDRGTTAGHSGADSSTPSVSDDGKGSSLRSPVSAAA